MSAIPLLLRYAPRPMKQFDACIDAFHEHFTRNPNRRVVLGVERELDELPDPSAAEVDARLAEARHVRTELDAVPVDSLGFDARLDVELARLMLDSEIHGDTYRFNDRTRLQQMPTAGDDIGNGIFMLFINDPRPAAERLADITARLEQVPEYVPALLARLDTPVARWVKMDVERVQGLAQLFDTAESWAKETGFADAPRLAKARAAAAVALEDYVARVSGLPTTTGLHVGADTAREIVDLRGIDRPFDELHKMARDFLAENTATIEELRGRLVGKYDLPADAALEDLERVLHKRYAVKLDGGRLESVLDRYQAERERILAFIRERDLFPVPDDQDMLLLRTPSFLAPTIPAGAMVSPAPFRAGTKQSLVYLTLSEELLDEHTELSIPGMMIHEGIPGHHLQLSTAAGHASVVRRHIDAMDQAEGWTTMLEDYMLDVGYMGDLADEARLVGKRDINRIGARVAIDLFFMTGDRKYLDVGIDCDTSSPDPFVAAGALLRAVTGFVPGRVQAELNWYSQERGYPLSYLTGNRLVLALKRDVARAAAGKLEGLALDRRFHEVYLRAGNMPLRFVRRVFEHEGLLSS